MNSREPSRAERLFREQRQQRGTSGLHYDPHFVSRAERAEIVSWLGKIYPILENRFAPRKLKDPSEQRQLLRPVYWLGNWQFACLDYYRPPKGVIDRCMTAEPFPPVMQRWVDKIEALTKRMFHGADLPRGWTLNTCLINLYGSSLVDGKSVDTARVGEHRDFEPGPVASISLGERALFQFVEPGPKGKQARVVLPQWLDDCSLQVFGGDRWKNKTFHRVIRVDHRGGHKFQLRVKNFETRRINFTFRYVPVEHVFPFAKLSREAREDVRDYVKELAQHSPFFSQELLNEGTPIS